MSEDVETIGPAAVDEAAREDLRACLDSCPVLNGAAVKAEYDAALWALVKSRIKPKSKDLLREINRAQVPREHVLALKDKVEEAVGKFQARAQAWAQERHDLGKRLKARPGKLRAVVYEVDPRKIPDGFRDGYPKKLAEKTAGIYRDLHPGVTFDVVPDSRPVVSGRHGRSGPASGGWCVLASVAEELDAEIIKHGPTVTMKEWVKRVLKHGMKPEVLLPGLPKGWREKLGIGA